jgi:hypothetical protein
VAGSSSVEIGIQRATGLDSLSGPAGLSAIPARPAPAALSAAARLGPKAYPSADLHAAVASAPRVSPFSAFYDIFLPAGIRHNLKNNASLTLSYDPDLVTDPSNLNIYYYQPNGDYYFLESRDRKVDEVNHTITVSVNHLSIFVVLNNKTAVIIGQPVPLNGSVQIHTVPNPFNLRPKSVPLRDTDPPQVVTTEGTFIKIALPSDKSGDVLIEIVDAAGILTRTIEVKGLAGGKYHYVEWDGRNDNGHPVSSGVYIARFTLNRSDERFFKMAVIK